VGVSSFLSKKTPPQCLSFNLHCSSLYGGSKIVNPFCGSEINIVFIGGIKVNPDVFADALERVVFGVEKHLQKRRRGLVAQKTNLKRSFPYRMLLVYSFQP
jgi:hypothetical protein